MSGSFITAFAMYSKIPMPQVEWNEKNLRYSLCFFPLIGAVIGALTAAVWALAQLLSFGAFLRGALLAVVPLLVTGGIHMDGFLDTLDARGSHADRERKLEILKDSRVGAFAVIGCCAYLLLYAAVWSEVTRAVLLPAALGFVLSRALSGIAVVSFRAARKDGLLVTFAAPAHRRIVRGVLLAVILLSCAGMIAANPVSGLCGAAAALAVFGWYRWFSYREFGGITGDLAGYFLQVCELAVPAALVLGEKLAALA